METTTSDNVYEAVARAYVLHNQPHDAWPDTVAYFTQSPAFRAAVDAARAQQKAEIVTALREQQGAWYPWTLADLIERGELG